MRRTCAFSVAGSLSLFLLATVEQFIVGNRVPQEERKLRREFQIGDRVLVTRLQSGWNALAAIEEERAGQHSGDPFANAGFETALFHSIGVILHQLRDVVVIHRTAICPLGERGENLLRASFRRLVLILGRIAGEDAIAAGRGTEAGYIEGAQKLERAHAVGTILPAAGRKICN